MPTVKQHFEHAFTLEAAPKNVWDFLWDIEAIARCVPGCEEVTTVEEGKSYQAKIKRKIGPFYIRFAMEITVLETEEQKLIRVEVQGRDKRLRSDLSQKISIKLNEAADQQSQVEIITDFELTGLMATLGERMLSGHIREEMNNFVLEVQSALHRHTAQA